MSRLVPITLAFGYDARFIPKGCRLPRERYFLGRDTGMIRQAEPHEVAAAYRVHVPPFNNCPEYKYEILQFEDRLWWPIRLLNDAVPGNHEDARRYADVPAGYSAARLIEELSSDGVEASRRFPQEKRRDGIVRDRFCRTSGLKPIESVTIRSIEWIRHDLSLARAQRQTAENLLLYDDKAYVLGGHPVFLESDRIDGDRPDFEVVSAAPDRSSWHPMAEYLPDYFGNSWSFRNGFDGGVCWYPDQAEAVPDRAFQAIEMMPRIETLIDPIESLPLIEIRLDALFRAACLTFLKVAASCRPGDRSLSQLRPIIFNLKNLADRAIDRTTTVERYSVLRRLADALSSVKGHGPEVLGFILSFELVLRDSAFAELARTRTSLTPQEEESLMLRL